MGNMALLWEGYGIFNHRAKRGGSLFEGSSVGEEGSRSDPKFALGARLRSLVFSTSFAPNVEIFG